MRLHFNFISYRFLLLSDRCSVWINKSLLRHFLVRQIFLLNIRMCGQCGQLILGDRGSGCVLYLVFSIVCLRQKTTFGYGLWRANLMDSHPNFLFAYEISSRETTCKWPICTFTDFDKALETKMSRYRSQTKLRKSINVKICNQIPTHKFYCVSVFALKYLN